MAKHDVYRALNGRGLLLDVQADLLTDIKSRVVVPLVPIKQAPQIIRRLNPVFSLLDDDFVMITQSLAAVPVGILTVRQTNLSDHFAEITAALDMLFQGF